MKPEVVNVRLGDARYESLVGQIRDDAELRKQMWVDAEHRFIETPDKVWTVVVVDGVPVAWCAARVEDGVLLCSDSYERRGVGRARGLYPLAYRHRHASVVLPAQMPAWTFLFAEPIALHEADGWRKTGVAGTSREPGLDPHRWWELRLSVPRSRGDAR